MAVDILVILALYILSIIFAASIIISFIQESAKHKDIRRKGESGLHAVIRLTARGLVLPFRAIRIGWGWLVNEKT